MSIEKHTLTPPVFTDKKPKILIVVSPHYKDISDTLVSGAKSAVNSANATYEVVEVPSVLEIPTAIRLAHNSGQYDGYVALGCVIRGETIRYEIICNDSSNGLSLLGLEGLCIGNGILTVEDNQQAETHANEQNIGMKAANAALHLIALKHQFSPKPKGIGFKPSSENIIIAGTGGKTHA